MEAHGLAEVVMVLAGAHARRGTGCIMRGLVLRFRGPRIAAVALVGLLGALAIKERQPLVLPLLSSCIALHHFATCRGSGSLMGRWSAVLLLALSWCSRVGWGCRRWSFSAGHIDWTCGDAVWTWLRILVTFVVVFMFCGTYCTELSTRSDTADT